MCEQNIKKRKTLKIMADWVSNLAPLGQNRVSRPPEQACLCVNAGLFILGLPKGKKI